MSEYGDLQKRMGGINLDRVNMNLPSTTPKTSTKATKKKKRR